MRAAKEGGELRGSILAIVVTAFVLLWATPSIAQPRGQPPALSPPQAAWLKAESRRIEEQFETRVARIVGTDAQRVRRAMPDQRRITVVAPRLIAALEMDLGRPLSDAHKAAIMAADETRRAALNQVREGAARH